VSGPSCGTLPCRPAGGRIPAARGPSSAPRDGGIDAWLADEHLVQTDWLYSIAVGGIKLQVRPEDAARARAVLDTDYSAEMED